MESLNRMWDTMGAERALLFWLIPLILTLIALYLLLPSLKAWVGRRKLGKILSRLGPEWLSEAVLEDGVDGLAHIDRIVVGPGGLTVVTLVPHDGIIFGADDIDRWTRVIGRRTIKFSNPVAANREGILAVRYHLPEAPVRGVVLFTGDCTFPKGKPQAALTPDELPVPENPVQIPDEVRTVWGKVQELARRTADEHRSQLKVMQPERELGRPLMGWTMLVAAGGWVGWRLVA